MEVRNACGRKVSLLNDEPSPAFYPYPRPNKHSRKLSYSTQISRDDSDSSQISRLTSPTVSPRSAPQLVRYNSSSSQGTLQTPSPMTPDYGFEPFDQNKQSLSQDQYYRQDVPYYSTPVPQPQDTTLQPYYGIPPNQVNEYTIRDVYSSFNESDITAQYSYPPPDLAPQIHPQSNIPASTITLPTSAAQEVSPTINSKASKPVAKKKYPCPHAKVYGCGDTFTTSGHAARHGKKHTGEKNIYCPTCNKAFTRKDNMKQHERTHKNSQDLGSNTQPSLTTKSPGLIESGSRENHSASRTRIKAARSRSTASGPSSFSNEPVIDSDDMEAEDGSTAYEATGPLQPGPIHLQCFGLMDPLSASSLRVDTTLAQESRPGLERKISGESQDGEGESPGLDALAMVASGIKSEREY